MKHKIEYIALNKLSGYETNSRTHSSEQVAQIAASITEFGFTNPILIDENNTIIAGHGRLEAAKRLDLDEAPCLRLSHLTEAQKKAYVIADNKLSLNAGWDDDLLRMEIQNLQDDGFNIDLLGFSDDELSNLFQEEEEQPGLTDEDEVPEPPEEPISNLGDVWILGNHRLMCGDSTSIDAVETLMAGQKADMVFTDPPYGIDVGNQSQGKGGGVAKKIDYGVNDWDKTIPFDAINIAITLSENCVLWGANYYADKLSPSSCWIAWDKDNGDTDFADIELAWTSYKKASRLVKWKWSGMLQQDMRNKERRLHPTQKPSALTEWCFEKFDAGIIIADLFGGSGSTLIACEKTNRHARLMELDPKYCDVIIKRWQDFTGNQAILESTGKTYAEIVDGTNE